jgi:hypothetical protein
MPEIFSGSAARRIAKRLAQHGLRPVAGPHSFLVSRTGVLLDGELERARQVGRSLASAAQQGRDAVPT